MTRQLDPMCPSPARALKDWVQNFLPPSASSIAAPLTLDPLGPGRGNTRTASAALCPAYWQEGSGCPLWSASPAWPIRPRWAAAGVASNTLFHEGPCAAHFANVTGSACFSQEFPPPPVACMPRTQSMFCDSLLDGADWLKRYARSSAGERSPMGSSGP